MASFHDFDNWVTENSSGYLFSFSPHLQSHDIVRDGLAKRLNFPNLKVETALNLIYFFIPDHCTVIQITKRRLQDELFDRSW